MNDTTANPQPSAELPKPPIIKKIKKGGHGHHGGAWKVAFADFAVAMMAFFLVMWLMANTTPEEKAEISGFFIEPDKYKPLLKSGPGAGADSVIDLNAAQKPVKTGTASVGLKLKSGDTPGEMEYEKEKVRLDSLKLKLTKTIETNPILKDLQKNVLIDSTSEGLRIQIMDDEKGAMFEIGSSELKPQAIAILKSLASTINQVPNKISITGHTDATPFNVAGTAQSNWELSTERANTARRFLVDNGLAETKVARVVGFASNVLFDPEHPQAPSNRRISIIILRKDAEENLPKN